MPAATCPTPGPSFAANSTSSATTRLTSSTAIADPIGNYTSQTSQQNPYHGGISTGAKVGIGVGVTILALYLLAAVVFVLLRRKKRTASHNEADDMIKSTYIIETAELPASPVATTSPTNMAIMDNSATRTRLPDGSAVWAKTNSPSKGPREDVYEVSSDERLDGPQSTLESPNANVQDRT
jgi:hypothetical protein